MNDIVIKVQETIDVILPVVLLLLGTLGLTNVATGIEEFYPVIMAILGAVSAVANIWGLAIRNNAKKQVEK
jgi:hypothetical protein